MERRANLVPGALGLCFGAADPASSAFAHDQTDGGGGSNTVDGGLGNDSCEAKGANPVCETVD